jgi:D-alanyl-D-alanine carboxypeptidase
VPAKYDGRINLGSESKGEKPGYLSLGIGAFIFIMIFSTVFMLMGGQYHKSDQNNSIKNQEPEDKITISVQAGVMESNGSAIMACSPRISGNVANLAEAGNNVALDATRTGSLDRINGTMDGYKIKTNDRGYKDNNQRRGDRKGMTMVINPEDLDKPPSPLDDWRIMLVNADNPVPKGYSLRLTNIEGYFLFDERAANDLKDLIKDCRQETNYQLKVRTGYRSYTLQESLYRTKIRSHLNRGKSRTEAERLTRNYIAVPGTSEHEIGLAVDFNILTLDFENTPAFKWLEKNAQKYGFILRYPRDKQSITKIKYEPWHFRYVGPVHARIMKSYDLCLEEYVDYLKN